MQLRRTIAFWIACTSVAYADETVVVRDDKAPRSASEVTRRRDVLTAAPHRTAADMLLTVPGVFLVQHSGEGKAHQIFYRGFDAVHGQDLEIWVGGAPVNEVSNLHGQGYADINFIMPEIVKSIHASPAAYDPRQGDFAIAGTLRVGLGLEESGLVATGRIGSFGSRRAFLAYRPEGASDETFAAVEAQSSDGFGPARASRRVTLVAQGHHRFGNGIEGRVLVSTYAARFDSAGVLRRRDIEEGLINRYETYDPKQGGSSTRTQLVMEVGQRDRQQSWSLAPYAVFRTLSLRQNFTGYLENPIDGDNAQQQNASFTIGATGHYMRRFSLFSRRDRIEAGFSARSDWIEQSQVQLRAVDSQAWATPVQARVRATDVGGYVDAAFHLFPFLTLRGGIRIDGLFYSVTQDPNPKSSVVGSLQRTAQGFHLGKKGTLDWSIVPGLHALVSYGEGFRSPQARSLADGAATPFTASRSVEAGVRYARHRALEARFAGFYTLLSDDLAFDHVTGRNEAVPGTRRPGLALDLVARPTAGLVSSVSVTYTRAEFAASDARYQKGDLLPYVPQVVARADIGYTRTIARLWRRDLDAHVGTGLTLLHRRPLPYGEIGHDIHLVDASASIRLKEIEIDFDVYNLFGVPWYDAEFVYASNFTRTAAPEWVPLRHVTVGSPRALYVTLGIHLF